jgi:hypothetical protein
VPVIISKEAQELAVEIGDTSGWALRAIECGLHSGYPRCCVRYFVEVRMPSYLSGQDDEWWDSYKAQLRATGVAPPGYVACPACLHSKNFVTSKACDCHRYRSIRLEGLPRRSRQVA